MCTDTPEYSMFNTQVWLLMILRPECRLLALLYKSACVFIRGINHLLEFVHRPIYFFRSTVGTECSCSAGRTLDRGLGVLIYMCAVKKAKR